MNLNDLYKLSCAKITYKKTQGKLHSYHSLQIPIRSQTLNLETRQKHDIIIKTHTNKTAEMNSINYKFGNVWNELPFDIKDGFYRTVGAFSRHVKKYYLSRYETQCKLINCYICNKK